MQDTVDPNAVYATVRRSLSDFEERVVARYWDADTPVRTSYKQFLSSLDQLAGRLLGDDQLTRRGQDPAPARPAELEAAPPAPPADPSPEPEAADIATDTKTDTATTLVAVTFTLPAEVHAGSVLLCGEFSDWEVNGIPLDQGADGTWRTTVALEPGSHRFRYLLDGERWENAWNADQYLPNGYGGTDSIIVVEPGPRR